MDNQTIAVASVLEALAADEELSCTYHDASGVACAPTQWAALLGDLSMRFLTFDSREVVSGTLFVCKGAAFDVRYLESAVASGAVAYLSERTYPHAGVPCIVASDVRRAMARLACLFYGDPSRKLRLVGVTGTKGKTTVAFYLDAVLRASSLAPSGLVTGVVVDDGISRVPSHNTTPESVPLQRFLSRMVDAGCGAAVMEVSSQGLKYDRTLGTSFEVGVFTNIGEDHISPIEHPTFEDYFASKLKIFDQCAIAVVNLDMDRADRVVAAAARAPRLLTYSMDVASAADVALLARERAGEGVWRLVVRTPRGPLAFDFEALGSFNVSNALCAVAVAEALGISHEVVKTALAHVHVPGRMERYDAPDGSVVGIVDYAHNEMSMAAVLACAREEFPDREVTVVFGATGERATHRRAGLGRAAAQGADRIILTEDDPGRVPVAAIAAEIGEPIRALGKSYVVVEDRVEAVHAAVSDAHRPAVVVLAGKGVEDTILRANGIEPCNPDAKLFCDEVGVPFMGYGNL